MHFVEPIREIRLSRWNERYKKKKVGRLLIQSGSHLFLVAVL